MPLSTKAPMRRRCHSGHYDVITSMPAFLGRARIGGTTLPQQNVRVAITLHVPIKEEEEQKTNFTFSDFECMQETGVHVPNLVVVQDADGHEWVFKGANTCKEFRDWLFGGTMDGSVCITHNFKGYDSHFILKYLYDNKLRPGLIMDGAKIMEMTVAESDIRFIDSLNFLPMALSKLPKMFGLTELAKAYFPHFLNTEASQHYVVSTIQCYPSSVTTT